MTIFMCEIISCEQCQLVCKGKWYLIFNRLNDTTKNIAAREKAKTNLDQLSKQKCRTVHMHASHCQYSSTLKLHVSITNLQN